MRNECLNLPALMDSKVVFVFTSILLIGSIYILWNMIDDEDEEKGNVENNQSMPKFIPTNEWQEVLPNQPIPPVLRFIIFH